jgi:hypothetical protein
MAKPKTEGAKMQAVNADVLVQLVSTKADNKIKIGEINGELGGRVKHHVELSGLNKVAYGFICKLDGMTPSAREEALTCLDLYIDMMHEKARWESHAGDLAAQAEAALNDDVGAPDDDTDIRPPYLIEQERQRVQDDAQVASNVTTLQRGISPLH